MNTFGYNNQYVYSQADELGKQTFGQQLLPSQIPDLNRDIPEPHAMPVPTGAPWNVQGISWGMPSPPELMYFTGAHSLKYFEGNVNQVSNCSKRKSLDVEPVIPAKQHITEEKMAAHMNSLHISSEYTSHSSDDIMDVSMEPTIPVAEKLKGHRIVLSEELKRLQKEPLLPAALIDRLEKPHMSLVVWKPRENILGIAKDEDNKSKDREQPQKRNGLLVSHHPIVNDDVEM